MKEECLICGAPLEYLETDVQMQCEICRKKELAKTRCVNGHYVCSDCHMQGLDSIVELCLRETACDPIAIVERMMALPSCHMHGPEHHVMVGAALLTAYHNAGGDIALSDALMEMLRRGKSVPGGACGFWGACGAGISTGMFVSIISGSTPLTDEPFALSHKMTAAALGQIGEIGGPRCCKRDSFLSILTAIDFVKEHFGIALQKPEVVCRYAAQNNQCIGKRCPFSAANRTMKCCGGGNRDSGLPPRRERAKSEVVVKEVYNGVLDFYVDYGFASSIYDDWFWKIFYEKGSKGNKFSIWISNFDVYEEQRHMGICS